MVWIIPIQYKWFSHKPILPIDVAQTSIANPTILSAETVEYIDYICVEK